MCQCKLDYKTECCYCVLDENMEVVLCVAFQNPIHAGNECWVLQSEGVKPQLEDIYLSGILALRCLLLKRTSPSDFDSLMEFYDECRGRNRSSDALDEDKTLVEFLLEKCKIPKLLADPSINKEFLHTFLKIVELCTVKMGESSAHEFVTQEGKTFKRFVRLRC